jgi:hypothetical protein
MIVVRNEMWTKKYNKIVPYLQAMDIMMFKYKVYKKCNETDLLDTINESFCKKN